MDLDRVRGVENLTGLEAVHPIAVLILARVVHPVATAIPRLDADERGVLRWRRPEAYKRRGEGEAQIRTLLDIQKINPPHLAVLQDEGIDIEGMDIQGQKALRVERHRTDLIAHTALLRQSPVDQARLHVESEIAPLFRRQVVVGIIEGAPIWK